MIGVDKCVIFSLLPFLFLSLSSVSATNHSPTRRQPHQGNGSMALVVAVLMTKIQMQPAEKRVHVLMMEKQLNWRVRRVARLSLLTRV